MHIYIYFIKRCYITRFQILYVYMCDRKSYNKVSPNAHLAMAQPAEIVSET